MRAEGALASALGIGATFKDLMAQRAQQHLQTVAVSSGDTTSATTGGTRREPEPLPGGSVFRLMRLAAWPTPSSEMRATNVKAPDRAVIARGDLHGRNRSAPGEISGPCHPPVRSRPACCTSRSDREFG